MYHKLQYISQGGSCKEQLQNIGSALDAGCQWIQLRYKHAAAGEFGRVAEQALVLCKNYGATFIINDHVQLAKDIGADGVHIGLEDMPVNEARHILGNAKIIGGTANTILHVLQRVQEGCDYIGLGPFRFTATKEKLSPVLGLQGYTDSMQELKQKNIRVPVYAIGGILVEDVKAIMSTGVHGIAVSGLITTHPHQKALVEQLNHHLHANT